VHSSPAPSLPAAPSPRLLQPWLHDLVAALAPPVQLWCGPQGRVEGRAGAPLGAQGLWCGDVRVLSRLVATVGGEVTAPVLAAPDGAGGQLVVSVARQLGDDAPDPTVRLEQRRRVSAQGLEEQLVLVSAAHAPVVTEVAVHLAADLLAMDAVKSGRTGDPVVPTPDGPGGASALWERDGVRAAVSAPGAAVTTSQDGLVLTWRVELDPGQRWTASWSVDASDASAVVSGAPPAGWVEQVAVTGGDQRLGRWVERSLADLEALRMRPAGSDDVFLAAGAPWYFTLFGRDSLWAARLLLPLGTDLAASTLRVLAARQGVRDDPATGEEPGKVLHELHRRRDAPVGLPPARRLALGPAAGRRRAAGRPPRGRPGVVRPRRRARWWLPALRRGR